MLASVPIDGPFARRASLLVSPVPAAAPPELPNEGALWPALAAGSLMIVHHDVHAEETALVLGPRLEPKPHWTDEDVVNAERIFSGVPQKVVASDRDQSPSLISSNGSRLMRGIGTPTSISRAPHALAVLVAAHVAKRTLAPLGFRLTALPDGRYFEMRLRRPEYVLRSYLTAIEYQTLRSFVAGDPYRQNAGARGRSERTIANQLRTVFGKLGTSGRFSLIRFAVLLATTDTVAASATGEPPSVRHLALVARAALEASKPSGRFGMCGASRPEAGSHGHADVTSLTPRSTRS
jgi:DNA-binding CsgD family transcriptional regulator